jgi:RecJ-like exonuclease
MNILEKLGKFTGQNYTFTKGPFCADGFTYSTNGKIMVRVEGEHCETKTPPAQCVPIIRVFTARPKSWQDVDASKITLEKQKCETCEGGGKINTCPECNGDGELRFENEYNYYTVTCESCYGRGVVKGKGVPCPDCDGSGEKIDEYSTIQFDGFSMVLATLNRIHRAFPVKRVGLLCEGYVLVECDGALALTMKAYDEETQ